MSLASPVCVLNQHPHLTVYDKCVAPLCVMAHICILLKPLALFITAVCLD